MLLVSLSFLFVSGDRAYSEAAAVRLKIEPTEAGVLVHYELPGPVSEFRLEAAAEAGVVAQFSVVGVGFEISDGTVHRADGGSFTRFDLLVRADSAEQDRVYAASVRLGKTAWVLYFPYLRSAEEAAFLTDCPRCLDPVLSARSFSSEEPAASGFIVVGEPANRSDGPIAVVDDGHVPRWLVRNVEQSAQAALSFHERFFGSRVSGRPVIAISQSPLVANSWRGDAAQNGIILLRIKSDTLKDDPGLRRQLVRFVAHETAHLWIGARYRLRSETDPWFSEGAAEYAGLYFALRRGYVEGHVEDELAQHLNSCARDLGDRPFSDLNQLKGRAVYDCGVLVQWWLDLEMRQGGANSSLPRLWRETLDRADPSDGQFALEDMFQTAGEILDSPLSPAMAEFLEGGEGRWAKFLSRLRELGVVLREDPSLEEWRSAVLTPFLSTYCPTGTGFGFWTENNRVTLDTGANCGPLSNSPIVVTVAGVDLATAPKEAFLSLRAQCEKAVSVWFGIRRARKIELRCPASLLRPDQVDRRQRLLRHLLQQVCATGPMGFTDLGNAVRLDTGQRCGPLSGDPIISEVAGHNLAGDIDAAWEDVRKRCLDGLPIELASPGSRPRSMVCANPMDAFQPTFQVEYSPVPRRRLFALSP
ncbi:hypothetical protein QO010_004015 [Caulobacter ginsengisoli]|uniref:Peptidase M1 membrane alanine aminopeptidase domain-containing protein n=1 Tax=Caulobacter ginsengisoli TaxID=400775 RepID=A0ABU0IW39_9CAUL|nr:hypothetical protein [Caulobacter ginsengisoli]MDQ0466222.1 hypothetical protein [Caulobacter ginsengisoli]